MFCFHCFDAIKSIIFSVSSISKHMYLTVCLDKQAANVVSLPSKHRVPYKGRPMMLKVLKSEINSVSSRMKELKFPLRSVNPMPLLSKNEKNWKNLFLLWIRHCAKIVMLTNHKQYFANKCVTVITFIRYIFNCGNE